MSTAVPQRKRNLKGLWFLLALLMVATSAVRAEFGESSYVVPLDNDIINYDRAAASNAITRLLQRIEKGEVQLQRTPEHGYLKSLLEALQVPVSSQMLVFSKTSLQIRKISPRKPRAVYFSDDVYVGWVQDSPIMEIAAQDPELGAVFYAAQEDQQGRLQFTRTSDCLQCHASGRTAGVPGHIVRSVLADAQGFPLIQAGSSSIDHRTPLEDRWGGWYVTGKTPVGHLGNQIFSEMAIDVVDRTRGQNVTDLSPLTSVKPYLSPHSDVVALMVLEHQARMHNLITAVNYEAKQAIEHQRAMNRAFDRPEDELSDTTRRRFQSASDALLKYLLFVEEAPLAGPVAGSTDYALEFARSGPRDRKGRSLRDLDLKTRMFRYPCSYLICSEGWDRIPKPMLDHIHRRLYDILTGKDQSPMFARLTADDRKAVLEILRDVKPSLPAYWRE